MKLVFRKIKPDDLPLILKWRTTPEVADYMYTDFEPVIETQRKWYDAIGKDVNRRDWLINVDGADVGVVHLTGIDTTNKRCNMGYYLGEIKFRGKKIWGQVEPNILDYVFESMKLNKLCLEVLEYNERGVAVQEKYGAVIEGRRRQHIFKRGTFVDIIELGIFKEDWQNKHRSKFKYVKGDFE